MNRQRVHGHRDTQNTAIPLVDLGFLRCFPQGERKLSSLKKATLVFQNPANGRKILCTADRDDRQPDGSYQAELEVPQCRYPRPAPAAGSSSGPLQLPPG